MTSARDAAAITRGWARGTRCFLCQRHGLNKDDTELVEWLVLNHLIMSSTAQWRDIYDPEVVFDFAQLVRSERRLDYLYALTVADITATNPTLWNSWRDTLLSQLYSETRKLLEAGVESPLDKQATIRAGLEGAAEMLADAGISESQAKPRLGAVRAMNSRCATRRVGPRRSRRWCSATTPTRVHS